METTPHGALDTTCCLCGGRKFTPSGVYGRWRANLGNQQEDRGTGRMEHHRQGHRRLLRGGQSGGTFRRGSSIVRTIKGMEMWSKIDPLCASQALKEWRTEHGSHKKSRDPSADQGITNRNFPLAQNRSLPASPQQK